MSSDPQRLREVLGELGEVLGVSSPAEIAKVWAEWRGIVGPGIAAHADPTSLRGGVLRIRVDSPTWATELGYLAGEIKGRVNRALGSPLVREVKVWVGPRRETQPQGSDDPASSEPPARKSPSTDDPEEAFRRARAAWSRSIAGHAREPSSEGFPGPSQNQEKRR